MTTKAKESAQVRRARQKIQKQIQEADKRINDQELTLMRTVIERQLARHQTERIDLKTKNVTPFDENQHSAKTESRFVSRLLAQLKQGEISATPSKQLEGRIKPLQENEHPEQ